MKRLLYSAIVGCFSLTAALGQTALDLSTPKGVAAAMCHYQSTSPGEAMDTAAIRTLFWPTAIFTIQMPSEEGDFVEQAALDDFLASLADPYYTAGFEERPLHTEVFVYQGIAHVWQSTDMKDSEGEQQNGLTSYQMVQKEGRWWIVSLMWTLNLDTLPEGFGKP